MRESIKLQRLIILDTLSESHLFPPFSNRKIIEVKIIDDEEYEKNKAFTIELGEPILLEIGQKHGGCVCECLFVCCCSKRSHEREQEQRKSD